MTNRQSAPAITVSYALLSLLDSILLLLGGLGYLAPVVLEPLGPKLAGTVKENWDVFIFAGVLIGVVNIMLMLKRHQLRRDRSRDSLPPRR